MRTSYFSSIYFFDWDLSGFLNLSILLLFILLFFEKSLSKRLSNVCLGTCVSYVSRLVST
jgi:uncharacterized sodium:solute symporter family permease YidK